MADFLSLFRTNTGNLKARLRDLNTSLERALVRREDLLTLPLPPADIAEMLCGVIDRKASHYAPRLLNKISFVLGDPKMAPESQAFQTAADLVFPAEGHNRGGLGDVEVMMAYMLGDQVKAGIRRALAESKYKCGPSRADRAKELAKLETEISELTVQRDAVRAELDGMMSELQ